MANLQGFRAMLTEYVNTGRGLPCIALKQDNEFGQAFSRIVTVDNRRTGESDSMVTGRYVDEICAALADESNAETIKVFDSLCDAFAAKVTAAWKSIGGVRESAREMAHEINTLADALAKADGYIETHAAYGQLSEDFPSFTWGGLSVMGAINEVIKSVHTLAAPGSDGISDQVDKRAFDIVVANIDKFVTIKKVPGVKEEDRTALVDATKKVVPDTPVATVVDIVDLVLGIKPFIEIFKSLKNVTSSIGKDFFKDLRRFDSFINDVYPVVDGMVNNSIALPEAIKAEVAANAMSMVTFCKIAAYYEHMLRTTIFREAFLLQDGMLNEDNRKAFEEAGGKPEMISTYIRKMYNDKREEIPALGVKSESIIKAYGNISEQVKEDIKEVERKVALARTKANVSAFVRVAREYLAKHATPEFASTGTYIDAKMRDYGMCIADTIRHYNINMVDACMSLIVKTEYPGTFVETLHDKLGVAYLAMVNDGNGEVNEEDICCAEVGVITDVVCEFVMDRFFEVVVCQERVVPSALQNQKIEETTPEQTDHIQTPEEKVKDNPAATPATES